MDLESEGLLKIKNNIVEFKITDEYDKYLKLCKENFDDKTDISIDDLISKISLNNSDGMSKRIWILRVLIEKILVV